MGLGTYTRKVEISTTCPILYPGELQESSMTEKPSTPPRLPIIHSVYTEPERPIAGSLFKLVIEGENFPENVLRSLFYTRPWDKEDRVGRFRSKIYIENCVYLPTVRYIERSEKRIVSLELIKESGIYHVTINSPVKVDNPSNLLYDSTIIAVEDPLALRESSEGQKTPGAEGEAKPAYQWGFDSKRHEVTCNGSKPVKLEPRLFELFKYFHGRKNIKTTMNRIRTEGVKVERRYKRLVVNRINKLISSLNKKEKVLGLRDGEIKNIIERHKKGKKLEAVTFYAK